MVIPEEVPLKTEQQKKKTLKEKYEHLKQNITVEPTLACYIIPGVLVRLATQTLNLDKACRVNLNYGDSVCNVLIAGQGNKYQQEEMAVQELVSGMEAWKNALLTAIPSFIILFLGAWSDRTKKRKICILLPIVGDLLMCISNILNAYYFYELPVQVTMFFEGFFPAITGGWIAMYMGAFSYIGDISSEESRTFRIGITSLCLTTGNPIGSALSGILLKTIGYCGVFTFSALLYLFSIVYGYFYIKDSERHTPENKAEIESSGVFYFLKSFFDIKHVKDTLCTPFKKGPDRRRTKAILVFASIAFVYGPTFGEQTVRFLFTRYKFNWDALMYSFYITFHIVMHTFGTLISISIFSRRFKWDDSVLGLISTMSKIIGGLGIALARNSLEMYLAVAIEMFNATSVTALRSISSKLVTSDELGKMISLFNLMVVVTSMVFGSIYSWMYMVTIQIDAGFVYYFSTVMTVPAIIIFVWFFDEHRKSCRKLKDEMKTNEMTEIITKIDSKEDSQLEKCEQIEKCL